MNGLMKQEVEAKKKDKSKSKVSRAEERKEEQRKLQQCHFSLPGSEIYT
jgi:hypothetical protein